MGVQLSGFVCSHVKMQWHRVCTLLILGIQARCRLTCEQRNFFFTAWVCWSDWTQPIQTPFYPTALAYNVVVLTHRWLLTNLRQQLLRDAVLGSCVQVMVWKKKADHITGFWRTSMLENQQLIGIWSVLLAVSADGCVMAGGNVVWLWNAFSTL